MGEVRFTISSPEMGFWGFVVDDKHPEGVNIFRPDRGARIPTIEAAEHVLGELSEEYPNEEFKIQSETI